MARAVELITSEIEQQQAAGADHLAPINDTTERRAARAEGVVAGLVLAQSLMFRATVAGA
jgi:hypothetical protein